MLHAKPLNGFKLTINWKSKLPEECLFISLNELREKIKIIDHNILNLVADRIELAKEIGHFKFENNLPIRNFQIEKQVMDRALELSSTFGLDKNLVTQISSIMIEASVNAQKNLLIPRKRQIRNQKILIIGGMGKMGKWFKFYFETSGFEVYISDLMSDHSVTTSTKLSSHLDNYDVIIIAVSLQSMEMVLREVFAKNPKALVIEISSMKSNLIDILQKAQSEGIKILSCHPMFGPDIKNLSGRNILILRIGNNDHVVLNQFKKLFEETAVNLIELPLEEHDHVMLYSLTISHFLNLVMGMVLEQSPFDFKKLLQTSSTTFQKQIDTTLDIFSEDPKLYHSIQHYNVYKDELIESIQRAIVDLSQFIREKDTKKFEIIMKKVSDFFDSN